MSSTLYDREAYRQLQRTNFYERSSEDLVPRVRGTLIRILNTLRERKFITRKEYVFLLPARDFKDRSFFLLPKLHKTVWPHSGMPAGRPVVSDCGSLTRNICNFIDFFLKPICEMQSSYLQDTGHLIAIAKTLAVSKNDLLFTLDVESLYTNVPTQEGVEIISSFLQRYPNKSRPDLSLLSILKLILTTNDFTFKGSRWLQQDGVAMGKSFGGSYANLFMAHWETTAMSRCRLLPTVWKRYQDDILGLWPHGEQTLLAFFDFLNSFHPKIKLSLSYGKSVNFLDLTLDLREEQVHYKMFSKDTDSHVLLPPTSHHPSRTFRAIIFGEILRMVTHSSSRPAFQATFAEVSKAWLLQGYGRTLIREVKRDVLQLTNHTSVWEPGFFPCGNCAVCPFTGPVYSFNHPKKNISYPIFYRLCCDTTEVIYIIRCLKCGESYVGETQRPIKSRIQEHLRNIDNHANTAIAKHFYMTCSKADFFFFAFKKVPNTEKRKGAEAHWISLLSTQHPEGLNVVSCSGLARTNLVLPFTNCANRIVTSVLNNCGRSFVRPSFYRSRNLREHFS